MSCLIHSVIMYLFTFCFSFCLFLGMHKLSIYLQTIYLANFYLENIPLIYRQFTEKMPIPNCKYIFHFYVTWKESFLESNLRRWIFDKDLVLHQLTNHS